MKKGRKIRRGIQPTRKGKRKNKQGKEKNKFKKENGIKGEREQEND